MTENDKGKPDLTFNIVVDTSLNEWPLLDALMIQAASEDKRPHKAAVAAHRKVAQVGLCYLKASQCLSCGGFGHTEADGCRTHLVLRRLCDASPRLRKMITARKKDLKRERGPQ